MGLRTDHSPAAGSEDRRSSGAESRACGSGVERDDADDVCARSALADLVRDVRLMGQGRAGDGPERVDDPLPRCDLS
jgi:hypothetical protein